MAKLPVVFKYGTRAQYDGLAEKSENALYFLEDTGEIYRGAVNLARGSHYEVELEENESIEDAFARVYPNTVAVQDDIYIVKALIADGKYSYTSYVYDNNAWNAMDGNYNANNVYLDDDIVVTTQVGTIKELTNGSATFAVKGLSIQDALKKLLAEEEEPEIVEPTYTLTASATTTTREIGGYIKSISWDGTWDAGSYEYGSKEDKTTSTGITPAYSVSNNKTSETSGSEDGTFDLTDNIQIDTVGSKTYATITGECTYAGSTYTPVTNIGSVAAAGAIEGKTITQTAKVNVNGYRSFFYGMLATSSDEQPLDSAVIRGLTNGGAYNAVKTFTLDASKMPGIKRIVIAYPADTTRKGLTKVELPNSMKYDAFANGNYVKVADVNVEGANGFAAVPYTVYVYEPLSIDATEIHDVTMS